MQAILLSHTGTQKSVNMTRKNMVQEFSLHNRDLRPVFLLNQITTISVRGKCVVVNIENVKAVVGELEAYFLDTENKSLDATLESILIKIKEGKKANSSNFTLIVIETIIEERLKELEKRYDAIEKKANKLLHLLKTDLSEENFETLLTIKKTLSTLETKVQEAQSPVSETLDDEEIIGKLVKISKHAHKETEEIEATENEIESILEGHLEQIEKLIHKISELNENIDDTQEILTLKMATIRNSMIKFDLLISIITAAMAVPAVIVGLYGMNVSNHLEDSSFAFHYISIGIVSFIFFLLLSTWVYLKRNKIIN